MSQGGEEQTGPVVSDAVSLEEKLSRLPLALDDVRKMFREGYTLDTVKAKGIQYMRLRKKGAKAFSLGRYDEEVYKYLKSVEEEEKRSVKSESTEKNVEMELLRSAVEDVVKRAIEEYDKARKEELRSFAEELVGRVMEYIEAKEAEEPKPVDEINVTLPRSLITRQVIHFHPKVLYYYAFINERFKEKYNREMGFEEFVNRVLEEHLEECMGLYVALGRKPIVGVRQ